MKKVLFVILILLICTSFVISCGSTSTTTATTKPVVTTTAVVQPTTTAAPTVTPKKGGTLKWIFWVSPKTPMGLPWELVGGEVLTVASQFDSFFNLSNKGVMEPVLALNYKVADDRKSITFQLRQGVKFIDGTPFNAAAAKFNMDKIIERKTNPALASTEALDEYTFKVNLNYWTNTALSTYSSFYCISPTAYQKNGEDWARNNPTGTGPFKYSSMVRDSSYKLVRNPDYWRTGKPYLDEIDVTYVSDANTISMAVQAGSVDCSQIEAGKTAADLKAKGFNLAININTTMCMLPDTAHPDSILANEKVRQAIEYALDREGYAKTFSYGLWDAPYQVPPKSSMGFNPNFTLARKTDIAKAKQLLTDAGYPNGVSFKFGWPALGLDKNIAMAVIADLAKAGITAELDAPPVLPQYFDLTNTAKNELFWQPIFCGANFNSALSMSMNPSVTNMNVAWGKTAEYIDLFNKSLQAKDPDSKLMWDISNYLTQHALVIPVICGSTAYLYAPYVMDGGFYGRGADWAPENIWLNK